MMERSPIASPTAPPIALIAEGVPPTRTRPLLIAVFALIAALGVGFWGLVAWTDREETLHHSREQVQSASRLMQEHVQRAVATSDLAVNRILDLTRHHGMEGLETNRGLWISLRDMVDSVPEVAAVWIHDADGNAVLSSRQYPTPPVNIADRAYFQAVRQGAELVVGERIKGRFSGAEAFTISRPILVNGHFQGVVHANVEIEFYRQFYEGLDLGPGSMIALYRSSDGKPVLRLPAGEPLDAPDGAEVLRRAALAGTEVFEFDGPAPGDARILSYQRVPNLPLVVAVGLSKRTELAAWRERTIRGSLLVGLAMLACAGLGWGAVRSLEREVLARRRLGAANIELDAKKKELEAANAAFATANRRMNLILHSASDSICGVDREGRVTFANPAASALTGYANAELLGGELHALIQPRRADGSAFPARESPVTEVLLSGEHRRGLEVTCWTRDGQPLSVEYTASPMLSDGKVEGAVVVFREIAERKRAEAATQRARLAAEAASRAKSDFLANMSHEIRTPMNAILGLVHLLQQTEMTARQTDYLHKVRMSAQSLLGILNDILDFSKVEAGKLELERIGFRLDDLLQTLAVIVGSAAQEKDIDVLFSVAPDVPMDLVGDPLRLQQVLINLAGNAIKFTEAGEVVVSVRLRARAGDRVELDFAVRDTGIGIPPDQRERLFEAFSQGDSSTTRRFGGTGLGLAICARLVRLMNGTIAVDSEVGAGSVFHFHAAFGLHADAPDAAAGRLVPRPVPRDLSVLVVDDNATAREVLSAIAGTFGWSATTCCDGRAALAELERAAGEGRAYDVVLMDWKMPEMDGIEAARRIRADSRAGTPMIIVISGYGRDRLGARFEEAGVAGFLVKPVTASTLLDAVTVAYAQTLPAEERAAALHAPAAPAGPDGGRPLLGRRLLVAEDNAINRQVACEILERAGAAVVLATTGREAVEAVERAERPFDALLLDVQMPEMDGFAATAAIRGMTGGARLPIVAMTAGALPADRQRCLDHGMDDHVAKPLDLERLFATLARWIGDAAPADAPGPAGGPPSPVPPRRAENRPENRPENRRDGLPDSLPGIDLTDALNRLDGDTALFRRFVAEFARGYGDVDQRIAAALEGGDLPRACAVAHELKSVAGNVGARRLSAAADAVQIAIHHGDPAAIAEPLPLLRAELAQVMEAARRLSGPEHESPDAEPAHPPRRDGDRAALDAAFPRFVALLRDSNFAAAEEFAMLAPLLAEWVETSTMRSLSTAIDGLDFTKALGIVHRIARDLGLPLPTV